MSRVRKGRGRAVFTVQDDYSTSLSDGGDDQLHLKKCVATTLEYTYPLKLMIPALASSSNCQWLYPITFGGGLVEGDDITLEVEAGPDCSVLVTTQSSTKVFHCLEEKTTMQHFVFHLSRKSLVAVLPDPIVCFKHARYEQTQHVNMAANSNLLLLDWLTAGRMARGELWEFTSYASVNNVTVDGETVFRDALRLADSPFLSMKTAVADFQVIGMFLVLGPLLEKYSHTLVKSLGTSKSYNSKCERTQLVGVSPLEFHISDTLLKGCVVRLAAQTTSQAFHKLHEILEPLFPTLGGNPFENKF
ncbi:Urease accessory protein D [Lamellibrachia satsuma]|nr:Urease accessory protein D [Lamellibrachia satsuma]